MTARDLFNNILNNPKYGTNSYWIDKVLGFVFGIDSIASGIESDIKQHIDIPSELSDDLPKCIDCVLPICSRNLVSDDISKLKTRFVYLVSIEVIGTPNNHSFKITFMYNILTPRLYIIVLIDHDSDILDIDLSDQDSEKEIYDVVKQYYIDRIDEIATKTIDEAKNKINEIEVFRGRVKNMKTGDQR